MNCLSTLQIVVFGMCGGFIGAGLWVIAGMVKLREIKKVEYGQCHHITLHQWRKQHEGHQIILHGEDENTGEMVRECVTCHEKHLQGPLLTKELI